MRWLFFGPLFFLIYGSVCFYIGLRLLGFLCYFVSGIKPAAFWIPFALLCCILVFGNFFGHSLLFLRKAGSYWTAIFMYMFMLLALSDFIRLLLFLFGKKIPNFNLYAVGAALSLCVILIVFGALHARSIKTVNYQLALRGSGSNIRIALISDLHIGSTVGRSWIKRAADTVNKAQPDIVCITGDIFDGNLDVIKDLPGVITQLKSINAPLGVYACLGNHDTDRLSISGAKTERVSEILKSADITLLWDEVYPVREKMFVAGRKDARPIGMSAERKTPDELLADIDGTVIVLDHQPTQYPQLEKAGADLVLSGHTHKGQLFPGNLFTWIMFKKMGAVHYGHWKGRSMQGVVTSGAAAWGPPLRIGTNSEVVIIDVSFFSFQ
jgi:predicted MPP superfamily phosphohydrolase